MALLTVIGKRLAKDGLTFTFMGPLSNCKECKVKNICFHLEHGRQYKIVGTRDVLHECPIHEEGVVVVEIEPVTEQRVIPRKQAMEGSTISIDLAKCRERHCVYYRLCLPFGAVTGQKRNVVKVGKKVDCPKGEDRVLVELQ